MGNIFQELQLLSMAENDTVAQSRKQLNRIVAFFKTVDDYKDDLSVCAIDLRHLELKTLQDADAFFVHEEWSPAMLEEDLQHDSLGFCRGMFFVFGGRLVYPVKDVKGDVMGFCGWDLYSEVKYLDSLNHGYKAKATTFYGMEKLPEYYRSSKPVFFVEGIVCCLYLRQQGFQAFATLGSYLTPYVITIAERFEHRAVFITDSDEAGNKFRKQVRRVLPKARVYQSTIAKDVDDSRLVDPNIVNEFVKFENPFYTGKYFI